MKTEDIVEDVDIAEFLRECRQKRFEQTLKSIELGLKSKEIEQRIAEVEERIRQKEKTNTFDMGQFYRTYYGCKKRDI